MENEERSLIIFKYHCDNRINNGKNENPFRSFIAMAIDINGK